MSKVELIGINIKFK